MINPFTADVSSTKTIVGFKVVIGIFIEPVRVFIGRYFFHLFPSVSSVLNRLLAFIISTFTIAIWFLIIVRYLPDGRPNWRVARISALFTSFLFSLGDHSEFVTYL